MTYRPLYVLIIVLVLSICWGYWRALAPYQALILRDAGYSTEEVAQFFVMTSIVYIVGGYGGSFCILLVSYFSGKEFMLNITSAMVFLLFLVIAIWAGYLLGFVVRQIEYPQYFILHPNFIFETLTYMQGPILWSLIGFLIGNLKSDAQRKKENFHQ